MYCLTIDMVLLGQNGIAWKKKKTKNLLKRDEEKSYLLEEYNILTVITQGIIKKKQRCFLDKYNVFQGRMH